MPPKGLGGNGSAPARQAWLTEDGPAGPSARAGLWALAARSTRSKRNLRQRLYRTRRAPPSPRSCPVRGAPPPRPGSPSNERRASPPRPCSPSNQRRPSPPRPRGPAAGPRAARIDAPGSRGPRSRLSHPLSPARLRVGPSFLRGSPPGRP